MPSMRFTSGRKYPYKPGKLYIGETPFLRRPVGIATEKHAIAIAAARSGKGVGVIMQNLFRWQHNVLCIDPKGEAAAATALYREKVFGQKIHVLDPFNVADLPERFKARLNFLDHVLEDSGRAFEDIGSIADGLIMRHDPKGGHWDGGGLTVISGFIAHLMSMAPPEKQNLNELRALLNLVGQDQKDFTEELTKNGAFGNLPIAAAGKLLNSEKEAGHFLSVAAENTKWLDSPAFSEILQDSTFKLSDLKTKNCSVFLVLPPDLLHEHGRFLRLFVRCALDAMARGGTEGKQCLFLLDEFYSLGHLDKIAKDVGAMPGYGLKLFPILQDLGQLQTLYDVKGAETFFANADLQQWFGTTDALGLEYISRQIGTRHNPGLFNQHRDYVGSPLMSPQEIRAHVAKHEGDITARRMIAFAQGNDILSVRIKPYFQEKKFREWVT